MKYVKVGELFTIDKVGRKALPYLDYRKDEERLNLNAGNLERVLNSQFFKDSDEILLEGLAIEGVDLSDSDKPVTLIGCITINSKLPKQSIIDKSILINTSTEGDSLYIDSHLESGRSGRCDTGPDCFMKDCSVYNGMVINSGTVMFSSIGAGTRNAHLETGVTIYGGSHVHNTYEKNVDVLYVNGAEVKGAYQLFLDRNNENPGFSQTLSRDEVFNQAEQVASEALLKSCKIVYPDRIVSSDYLINKSPDDESAGLFIRGEWRGQNYSHRDVTNSLLKAHEAHVIKHFKPNIPGMDNVLKTNVIAENYAEIIDLSCESYRRENSVQMLGKSFDSIEAFHNNYLSELYRVYSDDDYTIDQAVESIIENGASNLQSGIGRNMAHKMIAASAKLIDELMPEVETNLAPTPS